MLDVKLLGYLQSQLLIQVIQLFSREVTNFYLLLQDIGSFPFPSSILDMINKPKEKCYQRSTWKMAPISVIICNSLIIKVQYFVFPSYFILWWMGYVLSPLWHGVGEACYVSTLALWHTRSRVFQGLCPLGGYCPTFGLWSWGIRPSRFVCVSGRHLILPFESHQHADSLDSNTYSKSSVQLGKKLKSYNKKKLQGSYFSSCR